MLEHILGLEFTMETFLIINLVSLIDRHSDFECTFSKKKWLFYLSCWMCYLFKNVSLFFWYLQDL